MQVTRLFARILCAPGLLLPVSATAASRTVPHPGGGPALIIPAASPIYFRGFDKNGVAHFDGRFTVTGSFTYGCRIDCEEPPIAADNLEFNLVPDAQEAKRLPHWQDRGDGMVVEISPTSQLARAIVSRDQTARLISGKLAEVRGRISLVLDDFAADFGCDYSPYYAARFVSIAKPAKLAKLKVGGDFGCA